MRNWSGNLTEANIEKVAEMIKERLEGKTFAIASAHRVNTGHADLELRTGCRLESQWTDGSKEQVRVRKHDDGRPWLGFSAGHFFWSFRPSDSENSHFSFDYDGVEVSFNAPCGDRHTHCFRVERQPQAIDALESAKDNL